MYEKSMKSKATLYSILLLVFAVLCTGGMSAKAGQPPSPTAPGTPVAIGRDGQGLPWLAELGDAPYEVVRYSDIAMVSSLPAKTAYYEIDPEVVASGYFYFFHVRGVSQNFIVGSVANLYKLCGELAVLEEIKERNKGKEVAAGLGDNLKGIGTGFARLVMSPGQSIKSAGTRIRQTGRSLERAVGAEDKVGADSSGADRSHLGSGPAGATRRALAYEMGVDVYTSNPVMRQALIELSELRTIGSLATIVIPYGIGMLDSFNPVGDDEQVEKQIRDYEPYELRRLVGENLEPIVGADRQNEAQPLNQLLMNPNFTPRTIAYIGFDLASMREVKNLPVVLEVLAGASTPEEADMLAMELRLYSFFHRREKRLAAFAPLQNHLGAMGQDGVFYFMFFGDTLRPWKHTAEAFEGMLGEAVRHQAKGMEIWTIGDVNRQMAENAAKRGVIIRPNIFMDSTFFPAAEQRKKLR